MTRVALYVELKARPGRENELEDFLRQALSFVHQESETTAWFALRLDHDTFAIFDAFEKEAARSAHLSGKVAEALFKQAPDLLAEEPTIKNLEVLADKLPNENNEPRDLPPHAYAP